MRHLKKIHCLDLLLSQQQLSFSTGCVHLQNIGLQGYCQFFFVFLCHCIYVFLYNSQQQRIFSNFSNNIHINMRVFFKNINTLLYQSVAVELFPLIVYTFEKPGYCSFFKSYYMYIVVLPYQSAAVELPVYSGYGIFFCKRRNIYVPRIVRPEELELLQLAVYTYRNPILRQFSSGASPTGCVHEKSV